MGAALLFPRCVRDEALGPGTTSPSADETRVHRGIARCETPVSEFRGEP